MATKTDLIHSLIKKLDYLNKEDATYALNIIIDYLKEELIKGNRVELRGFGSFSIRQRRYVNRDDLYNTVYYKAAKETQEKLNPNK